ncbi:17.6 kDa class I heat shock protein [Elaeis guineensis]|uniref:16.9 kDa class I heat shock protein 1 n=1 Tax=Elaeis guineensis var. tenera TaxID=51953 RepID=A0A6I9S4R8_ELAGV|nr:16.9 kDa class I heat shock protein 1 [Elaeis guineensis]
MSSLIPWVGGRGVFDPFSVDLWDPWSTGNWLWDTSGRRTAGSDETSALARTNVDWRETATAHIFTADLPGVRKEEVKVEVEDGNVLRISGEKVKEEEDKTDTWHRMERRRGSFTRRFRLPENANMDDIRCSLANGVLTVTVPKKEVATTRNVRAIEIA